MATVGIEPSASEAALNKIHGKGFAESWSISAGDQVSIEASALGQESLNKIRVEMLSVSIKSFTV